MRNWLLLLVLALVWVGCIYPRKRGTGTNVGQGSGEQGGPWTQGESSGGGGGPALTGER